MEKEEAKQEGKLRGAGSRWQKLERKELAQPLLSVPSLHHETDYWHGNVWLGSREWPSISS